MLLKFFGSLCLTLNFLEVYSVNEGVGVQTGVLLSKCQVSNMVREKGGRVEEKFIREIKNLTKEFFFLEIPQCQLMDIHILGEIVMFS